MNKTALYLFVGIMFFLTNCQNTTNTPESPKNGFEDCKFGTPVAIFAEGTPTVVKKSFQIVNKEAIEVVLFESGTELNIVQSGCNEVQQELVFRLKNETIATDEDLFARAIKELVLVGNLSDPLKPFTFWAQAIYDKGEELKKGMEVELQPHTFASIDLIKEDTDALIRIVLAQRL